MDTFTAVAKITDVVNKSKTNNLIDVIIKTKDINVITYHNKVKLITKLINERNERNEKDEI